MYDHNQLEVPDSFTALHVVAGRMKAGLTHAQHDGHDLSEAEVLLRCDQGLLAGPSGVSAPEAAWVVRRLAELAEWACPELPDPPD